VLREAYSTCGRRSAAHMGRPARSQVALLAVARVTSAGEMSRGGRTGSGGACEKRARDQNEKVLDGAAVVTSVPPHARDGARESAEGAVCRDAQAEPAEGSRSLARRAYYGRAVSA
jgi:hypothetical protein